MCSVTAVVPAFNEQDTVAVVIDTLVSASIIDQVVVVNDGSTDNTSAFAKRQGVRVVDLSRNQGKARAMMVGLQYVHTEAVAFLDADLVGLTVNHVNDLCLPVVERRADMTVGVFTHGRRITDLAQRLTPNLSGQRVVRKVLLQDASCFEDVGYGVEVSLTRHIKKLGCRVEYVYLSELTHITKEEKLGLFSGIHSRAKMYKDILIALAKPMKYQ